MRICVMYDCLYPWTVGGAERWYRELAERLASEGHEVTYVTLTQWEPGDEPALPGVRVIGTSRRQHPLYDGDGKRRILPPLLFGLGVLLHLLRHGRKYDVVHTASFPFFSLLATALVRPLGRYRVVVDWHEVWSRAYWREYLGPVGGMVGAGVQWLCAQVPQRAFAFSRLHADRLRAINGDRPVTVLTGEYGGVTGRYGGEPPVLPPHEAPARPLVLYIGRHIAEKRVTELLPAIAAARAQLPELEALVLGDGPEREAVLAKIGELGLEDVVSAPGFVEWDEVEAGFRRATCLVLPSCREGYGLVLVEAAARGVPVVVTAAPDNAAVELVAEGENGFIAPGVGAEELGAALVAACQGGDALRTSTRAWFALNAGRLSIDDSLERVSGSYRDPLGAPTASEVTVSA